VLTAFSQAVGIVATVRLTWVIEEIVLAQVAAEVLLQNFV